MSDGLGTKQAGTALSSAVRPATLSRLKLKQGYSGLDSAIVHVKQTRQAGFRSRDTGGLFNRLRCELGKQRLVTVRFAPKKRTFVSALSMSALCQ
jgi:hypothetical protein